jgi:YegS/Rv2252/BmrU family lipid kinase
VIPAGTGNDFVRVLRYPTDPKAILDTALSGTAEWMDMGLAGSEYFLTVSGIGFDAQVAGWVNRHQKTGTGRSVFLRGILYHLLLYQSQPITVTVDDQPSETKDAFLLAAGNTAYYASGMEISPNASVHDGTLSMVWIGRLSRPQTLPMLLSVLKGKHLNHPRVRSFEAKSVTVDGPHNLWVHADGEIIGHLPITIKALPHAIRVRVGSR